MTTGATAGGAVLATAVGVGTAGGATTGSLVAQSAQTLAFTGASHTMLLVTVAIVMILAGVLLNGLARRHGGLTVGGPARGGPPLRL